MIYVKPGWNEKQEGGTNRFVIANPGLEGYSLKPSSHKETILHTRRLVVNDQVNTPRLSINPYPAAKIEASSNFFARNLTD
jgi:hypothetical protein